MTFAERHAVGLAPVALLLGLLGCSKPPELGPPETFAWRAQPITFSPPPADWYRQGENGGGELGVRFILREGGGQSISVTTYATLADRDRREAIARFISDYPSLDQQEFLHRISLVWARTDDPLSDADAAAARAFNQALDRAVHDYLSQHPTWLEADLQAAREVARSNQVTLAAVLPRIRLRPERMQEPQRWRIGYERDTTLAGHPAFAGDDTLITDQRALLYREVLWVVDRCPFKVSYQGTPEHLDLFNRVVASVRFPDSSGVAAR